MKRLLIIPLTESEARAFYRAKLALKDREASAIAKSDARKLLSRFWTKSQIRQFEKRRTL